MKISRLVKKGQKVVVYLDDGDNFALNYEIVAKFGLRKEDEIDEKFRNQLIYNDALFVTKNSAFRLLGRRAHSIFELKRKLYQKKCEKAIVEEVVGDLINKKYLNDEEFAEKFIQEKIDSKKIGLIKIRTELQKRGVAREIIDQKLALFENDADSIETAKLLAEKKLISLKRTSKTHDQMKQSLYRFLQGKGFKYDIIAPVIKQLDWE